MTFNVRNQLVTSSFVLSLFFFVIGTLFSAVSATDAADKASARDESELREELAYLHFQIGRGHDSVANAKNSALLTNQAAPTVNPGDELDSAGDLKFWAFEAYQRSTKEWDKSAKSFRPSDKNIRAQAALENGDIAWEAGKRALNDAIQFHRRAQEYFENVNNVERRTAVLSKLARNLQRLLDLKR